VLWQHVVLCKSYGAENAPDYVCHVLCSLRLAYGVRRVLCCVRLAYGVRRVLCCVRLAYGVRRVLCCVRVAYGVRRVLCCVRLALWCASCVMLRETVNLARNSVAP